VKTESYVFETKFGWVGLSLSEKGVSRVSLPENSRAEACRKIGGDCREPPAARASCLIEEIKLYFAGRRAEFKFNIDWTGATGFRKRVWSACATIPYGETRSYGWIAKTIGEPKAARAVGGALSENPAPIIVPCHRVVGKDGSLTGFGGGLEMKRKLLDLEANSR
jgi:methylated-DNA-[protein]-cysteine S-methyltransferase